MSYSESNGQVILTMSREDYETILLALGALTWLNINNRDYGKKMGEMMNRLNQGNPNYTPYQVEAKKHDTRMDGKSRTIRHG